MSWALGKQNDSSFNLAFSLVGHSDFLSLTTQLSFCILAVNQNILPKGKETKPSQIAFR